MASGGGALFRLVVPVVLDGFAFGLFTTKPAKIRELSRTSERGECFADQVHDPVPELVITRHEEASLLTIKGVID